MLMALAAGLTLVPMVTVDARDVRVGDLVRDGRGLPLRGAAAMPVVLRLPAGQRRVSLPGNAVAMLVRRHVPGLDALAASAVTISRRPSARSPQGCWASARSLAAGEAITERDVTAVACGGEQASVGVEGGAPVLRAAVAAGAPLGRLVPAIAARVAPGAT